MDNKKLIIIIGLCGSGKSILSKQYSDYIIFDDFITHFYDGNVIDAIKNKQKVCLIDPRLCAHETFLKYIKQFELYINKENIFLILFENDSNSCLVNVNSRNDGRRVINTINNYSLLYNINNYMQYNHVIHPVYQNI